MRVGLTSPLRRLLPALAAAMLFAIYLGAASRPWRAARFASLPLRAPIESAIALEPLDAGLHDRLGQYYFLVEQDAPRAIHEYGIAAKLNPRQSGYWLHLAAAFAVTGDQAEQQRVLEMALRANPTDPNVSWEVATFYLTRGDLQPALAQFRTLMQTDTNRQAAIDLLWRATRNVDTVEEMLPASPSAQLAFLQVLISAKETAAAAKVWQRLLRLGQSLEARATFPYVEYLLTSHHAMAASQVWTDLGQMDSRLARYMPSDNLIVNPGFDEEILNGGFDWRFHTVPGASVEFDTLAFHSGARSVAITFDATPVGDLGFTQYVALQPNSHYEFRAWVKSEEIESSSGPRVLLQDADSHKRYLLTEDVLGTSVWHEIGGAFETGPDATLAIMQFLREPATGIRGKYWIDDLRLFRK